MYKITKNGLPITKAFRFQSEAISQLKSISNGLENSVFISDIEVYDKETKNVYKVESFGKTDTYRRIDC